MSDAPRHPDEIKRLRTLRDLRLLDTTPEQSVEHITELAAHLCATPMALVSLLDEERQWFLSRHGFELQETPRAYSFCAHTILWSGPLVVTDTQQDARFMANPLVTGPPFIRFYAGVPLRVASGHPLGTLCVLDRVPRDLTLAQLETLTILARHVEAHLELRRRVLEIDRQEAALLARLAAERDRAVAAHDRFFELAVDPMCIARMDGYFERVNTAFTAMLGYTADELCARPFNDFVHPDDVARTDHEARQIATGRAPTVRFENRYLTKDGRVRFLAWSSVAVPDEQRVYSIARDVTERKELQAQLLHRQKMAAIGQLAGGIAHDFNNLMSVVLGFAQLVEEQLPPGSPIADDIAQVLKAGERACGLTRQLLTFSQRGHVVPPQRLVLDVLVQDLDRMLARILGEQIELTTSAQPALWPVRIDPTQAEQILVNLIVNARDAMPHGGALVVELENAILDADYARMHPDVTPGEYVRLVVSDTGVGMSREVQQRIFEPYFTTKEQGQGSGLGLATVFGIVSQCGGHIWVYSEEGRGTSFKVYLPRDRGDEPTQTEAGVAAPIVGGSETVLLVEDDASVRQLASRALTGLGYRVLEASSGEAALALVADAPHIDLLLTDVVMPGMRGDQLAAQLRASVPGAALVLMSGYTENAVARRELLEQGRAFIEKPLTLQRLARVIRETLDARPRR